MALRNLFLLSSVLILASPACTSSESSGGDAPDASPGEEKQPDASATQPDAAGSGLAACEGAASEYPGTIYLAEAVEVSPGNESQHALVFRGDLDQESRPDRLLIVAYHQLGVEAGTFSLPADLWAPEVCVNFDSEEGAFSRCASRLIPASGTLEITSVEDRMAGSLQDAVFVDDRDDPGCELSLGEVTFDEPIGCEGIGCP